MTDYNNPLPDAHICELGFSSGNKVELHRNEVIVFVGPNNSGKSRALQETKSLVSTAYTNSAKTDSDNFVVNSLRLEFQATPKQMSEYLSERYQYDGRFYLLHNNYRVPIQSVQKTPLFGISPFAQEYVEFVDSHSRLNAANPSQAPAYADLPSTPMQHLYSDQSLRDKLSEMFENSFGFKIKNNFRSGGNVFLHTVKGDYEGKGDRISNDYTDWLTAFPPLHTQGDGMRSYAGIIIHTLVNPKQFVFLDEPEAYLHPPQQRKLGHQLSKNSTGQLFIATHSSDILRGLVEGSGKKERVRVIRISRNENKNYSFEASPDIVHNLLQEPILNYSRALDAIFHEQAIICEDDSDCRLFQAIFDHLDINSESRFQDTQFIPSGGKGNIPKILEALVRVGANVKVICDLDLLSNWSDVEKVIEAAGGEPKDIESQWNIIRSCIESGKSAKTVEDIKYEIRKCLDASAEGKLPKSDISSLMKSTSKWWKVKSYGKTVFKGDALNAFEKMHVYLQSIGIFLVEAGEIENLVPAASKHGPAFVSNVLTDFELDDPKLKALRDFVEQFVDGSPATQT